jgi:hypothetical protein
VVQAIAEDVRRFSLEANSTGIEQHANFLEGDIGDGQLIAGGRVDPTRGLGAQLVLVSGGPGESMSVPEGARRRSVPETSRPRRRAERRGGGTLRPAGGAKGPAQNRSPSFSNLRRLRPR